MAINHIDFSDRLNKKVLLTEHAVVAFYGKNSKIVVDKKST
ncbi:MAG: hypothetical protein QNJ68_22385 [Microcoleaceae cyanobacterium MO_207.B10]|nr:hypothetical protein [Microcoleaceae cyanobacterium MO_207.B10]